MQLYSIPEIYKRSILIEFYQKHKQDRYQHQQRSCQQLSEAQLESDRTLRTNCRNNKQTLSIKITHLLHVVTPWFIFLFYTLINVYSSSLFCVLIVTVIKMILKIQCY